MSMQKSKLWDGPAFWALVLLAVVGAGLALRAMAPAPAHTSPGLVGGEAIRDDSAAPADLPAGATADWWSKVTASLAAREYEVSPTDLGPQAPNRRQNLRTRFHEEGIEIVPRAEGASAWSWGWRTQAWGRAGDLAALTACSPVTDATRVEYPRGSLVEWYENGPKGIEQGFRLESRPAGSGPILITGALTGTLAPEAVDAGRAIEFQTAAGCRVLRYDGLKVCDARGTELPAAIDLADGAITLRIDDADAVYPILIDPLLTTPDWTADGDAARVSFGFNVSTAGDVNGDGYSDVVVSAPNYSYGLGNSGRVFAYYGTRDGLPVTADWFKSGDQTNGFFGQTLATAGDVNGDGYDDIVIGAQNYSHGQTAEGRVWVYLGSAGGLAATPAWDYEGDQLNAFCGFAIGTAGDVDKDGYGDLFVSAENYSNGQSSEGIVWVFYGSADGLPDTPDWTGEGNQVNGSFGHSASTAGDVNGDGYADLVVSALNYLNSSGNRGRIYVYYGSSGGLGNTPWVEESPDTDFIEFGYAVAGAGDVNGDGYADILVGAPHYAGDLVGEGIVYLYAGSAAGPVGTPAWSAEGNETNSHWGQEVATAGDVNGDGYADILVGAPTYDGDFLEEGRAALYLGRATMPDYAPAWAVEGGQTEAHYGNSVATAGDVNGDGLSDIIVGAPEYSNGEDQEGQAFVYHGVSDAPQLTYGVFMDTNQAYAGGGLTCAAAGDVNADGYDDVLIGVGAYDLGQVDEGVVFLYLGTFQGLSGSPTWYAQSNQEAAYLGDAVAGAGDVNGDGYADVLVGAPYTDAGHQDEGAAFVWYGAESAPMGTPANAAWSAFGGQAGACFGYSVAGAGDVNGDGYADIIVGADLYDDGQVDEGAAFVYHGSADGPSDTRDWYRDSDLANAEFGFCVASAGDFNGDGYSDVIVGAYKYDHPDTDEGLAFVYDGSADGLTTGAPFFYAQGDESEAWLGRSVGCAGDVNGDGYSDIIIGVPQATTTEDNGGKVLVWYGGPTAPPTGNPSNADWRVQRNRVGARIGWCVGTAGDVNNDGYSDILFSTPYQAGVGDLFGTAFLYFGASYGVSVGAADWIVEGHATYTAFGTHSAYVGDVNGDGFGDVMISAPYWDSGQTDEGAVFLYYGNNGPGLNHAPMQWQADLSAPIPPLGRSEDSDSFVISGIGRTAAGRGFVRLVWEVKDFLEPFDGTDVGRSAWINTGAPIDPAGSRVLLACMPTGLTPGSLPHWRIRFEARNPFFPRGPWLHIPGNGAGEADLRMNVGSAVETPEAAAALFLAPCAPNPIVARGVIRYALPAVGPVRLAMYDVQGRQVAVLVDETEQTAGEHAVTWDGSGASGARVGAGVYFCRMEAAGTTRTERILVAR